MKSEYIDSEGFHPSNEEKSQGTYVIEELEMNFQHKNATVTEFESDL